MSGVLAAPGVEPPETISASRPGRGQGGEMSAEAHLGAAKAVLVEP